MKTIEDRFWDWATRNAIRFGTVLFVAHAIVTAPIRHKRRNKR